MCGKEATEQCKSAHYKDGRYGETLTTPGL